MHGTRDASNSHGNATISMTGKQTNTVRVFSWDRDALQCCTWFCVVSIFFSRCMHLTRFSQIGIGSYFLMTTVVARNLNLSQDKKFFAITFEISPFSKLVHVSDSDKQQTSPKWTEDDMFFFPLTVMRCAIRSATFGFVFTAPQTEQKKNEEKWKSE